MNADATVAAELGHLDQLEAHLGQQLRNELLKFTGLHGQQTLAQDLTDLVVVLLDLESQVAPHPLAEAHISTAVLNEARALTTFLQALDLGDLLVVHRFLAAEVFGASSTVAGTGTALLGISAESRSAKV